MKFNALVPELTVTDIEQTKAFYLETLGFTLAFEREVDEFIFLSFEGSQLMFEQFHENGWNVGDLDYPLGRGVNFQIGCSDVTAVYEKVKAANVTIFKELTTSEYMVKGEKIQQQEFLIQDPDGYLLRFVND